MRPRLSITLAVSCIVFLASCTNRGIVVALEADPGLQGRIDSIIAALPPPKSWTLVADREKADFVISLKVLDAVPARPADAAICGTEYLAAAVDLSDERYSVGAARARELGLEPLEAIVPPRRALAVDDSWPGEKGYSFVRSLLLSASSKRGGRLPAAMKRWISSAAAKAAAYDKAPLFLTAAGDIQVGEAQGPALLGGEEGIRTLLQDGILERLRRADIAVANLESPISSRGTPNPRKRFQSRMPRGSSAALKKAGIGLVLFGNNHSLDFGLEAFSDTLEDLAEAGLPMVGAGRDLSEATAARVIEVKPRERLAFVGYAFFPNERQGFTKEEAAAGADRPGIAADEEAALASVRAASSGGATVVVLAHGGTEYVERPSDAARALYARFVDAGAALVIGTHPHVLQGCEARSGALIAYSLGNFLFTLEDEPTAAWKGSMLDFLVYRGKVRGLIPRPITAGYFNTEVDRDREAGEERFSRLCAGIAVLSPLSAEAK